MSGINVDVEGSVVASAEVMLKGRFVACVMIEPCPDAAYTMVPCEPWWWIADDVCGAAIITKRLN